MKGKIINIEKWGERFVIWVEDNEARVFHIVLDEKIEYDGQKIIVKEQRVVGNFV